MSIIPVNTYRVRSLAKPSEIVAALSTHVQPFPQIIRLEEHKTFSGTISETGFRLIRIGSNRSSFRPMICGTFSADSDFTILSITIKHDTNLFIPLIFMFLVSFMAIYSLELLPLLVALFSNNSQEIQIYLSPPYLYYLLVPFGVVFLGYFLSVAFFDSEAYLAERELTKILQPFFIKPETSTLDQ